MRLTFPDCVWLSLGGLLLAAGCAAPPPNKPAVTPLDRYQRAYDQGRAAFSRELAQGNPTVDVFGNDESGRLDEETGLPQTVLPGSDMDESTAGRVSGHNDALREYIEQNGPPANSRKQWEKQLLHLARYFEQRSQVQTPAHLVSGAGHEVSPDGRYTLMLRETSAPTRPSAAPGPELILLNKTLEKPVPFPAGAGDQPDVLLIWGPSGSDTAIFSLKPAGRAALFAALDLRTGRWLRTETAAAPDQLTQSPE